MQEDHCEFVSVPQGFKLIASSDACFNEAMAHHEKNIFGVQFHPEVSGLQGSLLIENFYKICQK
jgi:GMP synthase (glutamine-hydrolysing)